MYEREQVNLRVPKPLRLKIEERAKKVGISRNEWMIRALTWATEQPPTERARTVKEEV